MRTLSPLIGNILDLTAYGRQETWEDSPSGWPQTPPYQWWRLHDEYEPPSPSRSCCSALPTRRR